MTLLQSLKRNLAATWIAHLLALAIGLFLMPYVLRILGDSHYGVWIFLNSIAGYSGLLYLGMGEMVARYASTHHARKEWHPLNQIVSVVFSIYAAMGLVALLVGLGFAWAAPTLYDWKGISPFEVRASMILLALNIAIGLASSVFGGVLMGIQRFDIVRGWATIAGIARLVMTVLFLRQEWGLLTLSLIYLVVTLLENLGQAWVAYRVLPTLSVRFRHWSWERLKDCFSFSSFTFLENVAHRLIYATDSIVIGILLGADAIVPYFVGSRLCEFIIRPISQIGSVSMTHAGALHAQGERGRLLELVYRSVGLSVVLTSGFFIGALFFGQQVITTWVGEGYTESQSILMILLLAQLVAIPVSILRAVLFGMGHIRLPSLMYLLEAICNLGLTLAWIGPYGLRGVAWGTTLPLILIELVVITPYALRKLELGPVQLLKGAIQPYLIPLALLIVYSQIVHHYYGHLTGWLAIGLIAAGGGAVLGLSWQAAMRWIPGITMIQPVPLAPRKP